MSVLFLPPSAGAASVPDASETVSGKIRIATSAEATAGTNDLTAMTPAKTKSVVDAAVVGGVTYQGTFDASAPADLSNAEKGDLYIISVAGTYQGQTWAVGDHLLINADMGGTLDPAKIDKVDNTDSVTSVAGRTGAVTLSTADISGLATVASTGAYSDLTGAPTLATVATTGAYSDLSGTPSLATVATTGAYSDLTGTPTLATVATTGAYSDLTGTPTLGTAAAEDVGTLAGNVVQLDGTAKLPAVDGSQLTNLPNGTLFYKTQISSLGPTLSQITDNRRQHYDIALTNPSNPITLPAATSAAVGGVVSFFNSDGTSQAVINSPTARLLSGSSVTSFTVEPYEARSFVWVGASSLQEITATRLDHFNGVSITSPSNGEALVYNSTSGDWENSTVSASVAALNDIGDVSAAAPSNTNVIKYNSTSGDWESGAVAYSEVTGTPTLGTAAAEDVGTSAGNVVQLDGTAKLPAVDGSQLTNLPTSGFTYQEQSTNAFNVSVTDSTNNIVMCSILGTNTTVLPASSGVADGTVVTLRAAIGTTLSVSGGENLRNLTGTLVSSVVIESGQNMSFVRGSTSSFGTYWNQLTAEEGTLNSLYDVKTAGAVATNVLKYDGTDWVDGAVAYSEVTGTPTLATVATTGAYSDLTGTPTLATVATTGAYSDLTGTPTLGTAAALDVGTSANNVVQLNGSAQLPAVDGSQLTGISATVAALNDIGDVSAAAPNNGDVIAYNSTSGDWEATAQSGGGGSAPNVTVSSPSVDQTLSAPSGIEEAYIYTPSTDITVNLVAAATCGSGFKYQIKNRSTNTITIDPNGSETIDGSTTLNISTQEANLTLITDGSNWFII